VNFLDIGPLELILAFVIFLIVFGPQKIPEIGAKMGKLVRQARKASGDFMSSLEDEKKDGE